MHVTFGKLQRLAYGSLAIALLGAATVPALSSSVSALQVSDRYIKMSSSATGSVAAGQNVTYEVGFEVETTGNIQGVVVDFCANTPIIGDACTAPTGFTVGTPTVTTSGAPNTGLSGVWTAASENSGRTLTITNGTGGSVAANTDVVFTLSTATNPTNVNTTFYARILTFATTGAVTTWLGTANGSSTTGVVDSGGVALSTAAQITVTAKVQETLTFCVYTDATLCANGGTAVGLGDTNGVLSTSGPFVDKTTKYDVATNASSGAIVRFKAGLPTSGGNTLATISTTGAASTAGTTQFGLCSYVASGANLTIDTVYDGAAGAPATECSGTSQTAGTGTPGGHNSALFAFDTTAAADTFGDTLATASAGPTSTGHIAYIGNVSATQPAGIYVSTFNFIATGTY